MDRVDSRGLEFDWGASELRSDSFCEYNHISTGLMFILIGFFVAIATAMTYSVPRVRNVETELPDFNVLRSGA